MSEFNDDDDEPPTSKGLEKSSLTPAAEEIANVSLCDSFSHLILVFTYKFTFSEKNYYMMYISELTIFHLCNILRLFLNYHCHLSQDLPLKLYHMQSNF